MRLTQATHDLTQPCRTARQGGFSNRITITAGGNLFKRKHRKNRKANFHSARKHIRQRSLALESLEQRRVLSVAPAVGPLVVDVFLERTLTVFADDEDNDIEAFVSGVNNEFLNVRVDDIVFQGNNDDFDHIKIFSLGGNDTIVIHDEVMQTTMLDGGSGHDTISGSLQNDIIIAGIGKDWGDGRAGNDWIEGDPFDFTPGEVAPVGVEDVDPNRVADFTYTAATGVPVPEPLFNDTLLGGDGEDTILGALGNDWLEGGSEGDHLEGGSGFNVMLGQEGNDKILGSWGPDAILGGAGDDRIDSGGGNDAIAGGDGNDWIWAGAVDDWVFADGTNDIPDNYENFYQYAAEYGDIGHGDDHVHAGEGFDIVFGSNGNDFVDGEGGIDIILGGWGDDELHGGAQTDLIIGDPANILPHVDALRVELSDNALDAARDRVNLNVAQVDPGPVPVMTGKDSIFGEGGTDLLFGMFDSDPIIDGGADRDYIFGGSGGDTIEGGAGDDEIWAGIGNDTIGGGIGNDWIWAGAGDDTVFGDGTNDPTEVEPIHVDVDSDAEEALRRLTSVDVVQPVPLPQFNDHIHGEAGKDEIHGQLGGDIIEGGDGDDHLVGGRGSDAILGGAGDDSILAGLGNDVAVGGSGDDRMDLGAGHDWGFGDAVNVISEVDPSVNTLYEFARRYEHVNMGEDSILGQDGGDIILAGNKDDFVDGGNGNDIILGGWGDDELHGGAGDDIIIGDPRDITPYDVPTTDQLATAEMESDLVSALNRVEVDLTAADPGDIVNVSGKDSIFGEEGHDILLGMFDNDVIIDGGACSDLILGGAGGDTIEGSGGDDEIHGGWGDDTISSGVGNDWISGGGGDDKITGDISNDPDLVMWS